MNVGRGARSVKTTVVVVVVEVERETTHRAPADLVHAIATMMSVVVVLVIVLVVQRVSVVVDVHVVDALNDSFESSIDGFPRSGVCLVVLWLVLWLVLVLVVVVVEVVVVVSGIVPGGGGAHHLGGRVAKREGRLLERRNDPIAGARYLTLVQLGVLALPLVAVEPQSLHVVAKHTPLLAQLVELAGECGQPLARRGGSRLEIGNLELKLRAVGTLELELG